MRLARSLACSLESHKYLWNAVEDHRPHLLTISTSFTAWYNALASSFLPALSASSALVRSYGAVCTTAAGVLAMMALKPHSATAPTSESAGGYRPPA